MSYPEKVLILYIMLGISIICKYLGTETTMNRLVRIYLKETSFFIVINQRIQQWSRRAWCEELSLLKLERDMWKVEVDESCRLQDILESSEALRWRDQDPRLVS
ncbi:hypothetical protein TNCT_329361 [Trichonephila clavata]|uniref:Uncharacterized protein n=1 Tax=Trichonephila clavata TaxID=2740835 RepID=A0A8X6JHN4_TRICU|nr:hypothetical protein TNCT_329361 [Trichonephila clavata]